MVLPAPESTSGPRAGASLGGRGGEPARLCCVNRAVSASHSCSSSVVASMRFVRFVGRAAGRGSSVRSVAAPWRVDVGRLVGTGERMALIAVAGRLQISTRRTRKGSPVNGRDEKRTLQRFRFRCRVPCSVRCRIPSRRRSRPLIHMSRIGLPGPCGSFVACGGFGGSWLIVMTTGVGGGRGEQARDRSRRATRPLHWLSHALYEPAGRVQGLCGELGGAGWSCQKPKSGRRLTRPAASSGPAMATQDTQSDLLCLIVRLLPSLNRCVRCES